MNVFVLSTGRCGSKTFARACGHATNFTAAHESRIADPPSTRLDYPSWHIESDMRLIWFAGALAERYPNSFYVHLIRDREEVAESFLRRFYEHPPAQTGRSVKAKVSRRFGGRWPKPRALTMYAYFLLMRRHPWPDQQHREIAQDYVDTVNANIRHFMRDKPHETVRLETAAEGFKRFWRRIGAKGDWEAAVAEWDVAHNAWLPSSTD